MTPLNSGVLIYPGGREELPPHKNLHYPCVANFVSAVLEGKEPHSSGATALATAWVTDEALRGSADKPVTFWFVRFRIGLSKRCHDLQERPDERWSWPESASRMDLPEHAACFNRVPTTTSSSAPKPAQIISSFTVRQSVLLVHTPQPS